MRSPELVTVLCCVLLLGAVGCDDDDGGGLGSGTKTVIPVEEQADFEADFAQTMEEVIVPGFLLLGSFDPFGDVVVSVQRATAGNRLVEECQDVSVDVCPNGGMAEVCTDEEALTASVEFTACVEANGFRIDGLVTASATFPFASAESEWDIVVVSPDNDTITFQGEADLSGSETSLVLDFDMQVGTPEGDGDLDGRLTIQDQGNGCTRQTADDVRIDFVGEETAVLLADGDMVYCTDLSPWPDGERDLSLIEPEGDFRFQMDVDSNGSAVTDVKDHSSGALLAVCTTLQFDDDQAAETTSCEFP